jgi:hypothetical protein
MLLQGDFKFNPNAAYTCTKVVLFELWIELAD